MRISLSVLFICQTPFWPQNCILINTQILITDIDRIDWENCSFNLGTDLFVNFSGPFLIARQTQKRSYISRRETFCTSQIQCSMDTWGVGGPALSVRKMHRKETLEWYQVEWSMLNTNLNIYREWSIKRPDRLLPSSFHRSCQFEFCESPPHCGDFACAHGHVSRARYLKLTKVFSGVCNFVLMMLAVVLVLYD